MTRRKTVARNTRKKVYTAKAVLKNRLLLFLFLLQIPFWSYSQEIKHHHAGVNQNVQQAELFLSANYQYHFSNNLYISLEEGLGWKRMLQSKLFYYQEVGLTYFPLLRTKWSFGPTLTVGHGMLNFASKENRLRVTGQYLGPQLQYGERWKWQFSLLGGFAQNRVVNTQFWYYDWKAKIGFVYAF